MIRRVGSGPAVEAGVERRVDDREVPEPVPSVAFAFPVRGAGPACATSASCSLRTPSVSARPVRRIRHHAGLRSVASAGLSAAVRWRCHDGHDPHRLRPPGRSVRRTRRSGSAGRRTASGWRTRSTAAGRRSSSPRAGSATSSTTGRARSGATSSSSSGALATVVRYDERGFGMSDWAVDDFSLAGPARRPRGDRRRGRATSGSRCSGCPAARPSRWPTRSPTRSASAG